MPDDFEEQTPQTFDIGRYVGIVRRRHALFLILLLLGWAAVWGGSWALPARYKSSTMILVQEPTMPRNYVEPNVSDDLQDRLQSISQQILSRTRLLLIINKFHLYEDNHHVANPDAQVAQMRKDIGDIELVRDPQEQITAFRVSYSAPNPRLAQEVTGELTDLFINENLEVQQRESENTTAFMQQQLASARQNLADQNAKVQAFQAAHEGELPTQETSNLQILSGLQTQLQSEQDGLNSARQQRAYLQSLVDQYRAIQEPTQTASGAPTPLAALDQRLATLQSSLTGLLTRYTNEYPEVQQVRAEIAKTEKAREQMLASLKANAESKQNDTQSGTQAPISPEANPALLQLEGQLHSANVDIASHQGEIVDLQAKIAQYQARLNTEPAVEQQLTDLSRGYEQSQTNYNQLLQKESDSQMATSMEQMQEGERFTMLDPPSLPLRPDFPNHLKLCGAGFGVGAALGIVIVGLLEFMDDRLHTEKEIKDLLPGVVISEIPEILSPRDASRNRRRAFLGWAMAAVVFVTILAGTAFSYLHA